MSLVSDIEAIAAEILGLNPSAADAVNAAKTTLQTEASNAEAALEQTIDGVVDDLVNTVVDRIPIFGPLLQGEVDSLANSAINSLIGKIAGRFGITEPVAPVAKPAAQAEMAPIPNP